MSDPKTGVFHPVGVLKEAFSVWFKNLIPVVALFCINIFFIRVLQLSKAMSGSVETSWVNLLLTILFGIEVLAVFVLNCFVVVLILNYFKNAGEARVVFVSVFEEAKKGVIAYLKAFLLLGLFVIIFFIIAIMCLSAGRAFYGTQTVSYGIRMAVLLAASTVFVVLAISTVWYGFFFSFAPLVAAFEKKGPWASMQESRLRMKGHALRYLFCVVGYLLAYLCVGLMALFILKQLTHERRILNLLDPALSALFMPFWYAIWWKAYQRLSELKKS